MGCSHILVWSKLHYSKLIQGRKGKALSLQMPSACRKLEISDEHTVFCPISTVIPETFYSMLVEFQTPACRRKDILRSGEMESRTG